MDPANYGPGKYGDHITWLGQRLVLHGFGRNYKYGPGPRWGEADRANVQNFQLAQGWTGSDADGLPGRESLRRLAKDPDFKRYPAEVLDLDYWKVTLPVGQSEKPAEVKQPALETYRHEDYFYVIPDNGVAFRAPVDGVTTSGSGYPRCELREMWVDGKYENARWSMKDGRNHVMSISQAIMQWPSKGKRQLVAGQIHDSVDDICMIRFEAKDDNTGSIYAEESRGKSAGSKKHLLYDNYKRGERFDIRIEANKKGVYVYYNDRPAAHWDQQTWTDDKNYFKAGCYTQANENNGSGFGEVVIFQLKVTHNK